MTSRAARLIEQLLNKDLASNEELARGLGISRRRLDGYRAGVSRMPLESQRRLAELVIKHAPELAREARRLQLQCKAEEAFLAKVTATHMVAPPAKYR